MVNKITNPYKLVPIRTGFQDNFRFCKRANITKRYTDAHHGYSQRVQKNTLGY